MAWTFKANFFDSFNITKKVTFFGKRYVSLIMQVNHK